jgi:hypothetical protein
MSKAIEIHSPGDTLVAIAEKASLFHLLQQALCRQRGPQELPGRLYDDLGILPCQGADFGPHGR